MEMTQEMIDQWEEEGSKPNEKWIVTLYPDYIQKQKCYKSGNDWLGGYVVKSKREK
jgi:hypothetical protein